MNALDTTHQPLQIQDETINHESSGVSVPISQTQPDDIIVDNGRPDRSDESRIRQ